MLKKKWNSWRVKFFCLETKKYLPNHSRRSCRRCRAWYAREWRRRHPSYETETYNKRIKGTLQETAKKAVYIAVRAGRLPKVKTLKCVDCGRPAQVYDHRDYLKLLEVQPVCVACNRKRGKGKNKK